MITDERASSGTWY